MIGEMELIPTDIIAIINKAWEKQLSSLQPNKKAIGGCGWFQYNRKLLIHKQLCDTMTMEDIIKEKNVHWCHLL